MRANDLGVRLRVLVADDHRDTRQAIEGVLSAEFDVIGSVANGKDLLRDALALHPDVIVTDIAMPFLSGPQVMDEVKSRGHDIPFVLISVGFSGVDDFIDHGATAIVRKHDMASELAQAVRSAASRKTYVSRSARSANL
jgi:DNA-binding NarL/FixJ family response regulator